MRTFPENTYFLSLSFVFTESLSGMDCGCSIQVFRYGVFMKTRERSGLFESMYVKKCSRIRKPFLQEQPGKS